MLKTFELHSWRAALKGLAALALWPAITGCLPSLGYLVGQNWLLPAWILGGGVAAWAAWRLGRWRALLLCVLYAALTLPLSTFFYLGQSNDYINYHYPQVLLLEAGWNPVLQSAREAVDALAITPSGTFRPFHTLCFPLLGAQWSAATDLATGVFTGFDWAVLLILPAVAIWVWATLRRCAPLGEGRRGMWRCAGLTVLALVLNYRLPPAHFPLDNLLYLITLAWLMALWRLLCGERTRWLHWLYGGLALCLAGLKQSALIPIALGFLLLIAQALLPSHRAALPDRLRLCVLSAVAIGLCWFHPYATNWVLYGSPLFPAHSFLPAFQGWDITADLQLQAVKDGHPGFATFCCFNWSWLALVGILGLFACKFRQSRAPLALALLLLLTAVCLPPWLYTYRRYAASLPLIALLLLTQLPRLPPLPLRKGLLATLLLAIFSTLLTDSQPQAGREPNALRTWLAAANAQTIAYFPEECRPGDVAIVSSFAFFLSKDSSLRFYPIRYPERAGFYALNELLANRHHLPITLTDTLTPIDALRHYDHPSHLHYLVRKGAPIGQKVIPRDKPLTPSALWRLARLTLRNFRRRWLEAPRDNR